MGNPPRNTSAQWRRQDFVTGGGSEVWVYRGSRVRSPAVPVVYCLCINVALCSTALQCICRVIRRSSMTMKAHTYCIIFGRPPIGGEASSPPGGATASAAEAWERRGRSPPQCRNHAGESIFPHFCMLFLKLPLFVVMLPIHTIKILTNKKHTGLSYR